MKIKEDYICPKCKTKNRIKIYSSVSREEIKKVIDKSIFTHECKKCQEKVSVEYPLKVIGNNYTIFYTPSQNETINDCPSQINRVCDTYADLKEKILILEDNLNDILIEEIKNQIKNNLDILDIKKSGDIERIRYNSRDESNIYFSLVGINQLVGISISHYQNMESKITLKKINKSILIDEYTYKNYIRRGHYEITGKKRISFFKW